MLSNSDVPPDGFVNTGLIVLPTTLTRAFSLKSDMPLARMWQASAVYGSQIYAFGGAPNTSAVDMNSVINQMYDTSAGGWKVMEPMSARRFAAAAVTFDDTIFVMGGFTGSTAVNANEAYSPRSNSWSPSQPKVVPMSAVGAAGARYDNMVILLGGNGSGNATLQIYTPQTNQWSTFNTQAPQFTGGGAVMVGSRLYVLGGNTKGFSSGATSSVYGYLEMSNLSWTSIPAPSSVGFYFSGAALLNDKIYLMGGVNYNGSSWSSVYVLDYKTNTWTNSSIELAVATAGLSSAAVGNAMYVIGGGTTLNGPALANTQTSEANLFYLLRKL
jgi:N-acetylneuraminic acid mutarotase